MFDRFFNTAVQSYRMFVCTNYLIKWKKHYNFFLKKLKRQTDDISSKYFSSKDCPVANLAEIITFNYSTIDAKYH